jgi:hypothetical protein
MFRVRNGNVNVNYIGGSYVAYVFAHETSVNGLIQCGIYTGNGSTGGPSVNLGWEPQFILIKNTKSTGSWQIIDNLRGLVNGSNDSVLLADSNAIESSADYVLPTTTGFQIVSTSSEVNTSAGTYIYLAVRRPNKPPTNGSQVFSSETLGSSGITNAGFPVDLSISHFRNSSGYGSFVGMRVTNRVLMANTTASEVDSSSYLKFDSNKGVNNAGLIGPNTLWWQFKRAPKFFDIICYQGNNINGQTFMHNLGVTPQLIITKARTTDTDNGAGGANKWNVRYGSSVNAPLFLNESSAPAGQQGYIDTMTSTSYRTGTISQGVSYLNTSGVNYVALLFATLAQVSKVGSYVGNGSSQTINCGFITGARFILIKRYDSIGDWYIWDSSRGINALTDPYLILNSMNAEVTTDDSVDPENSGFIVKQNTTTNINVLSASYFFFAIA